MSEVHHTTRRRFILGSLGAGSALTFVLLRPWRALVEVTTPPLTARLTGLLEHPRSARVVGLEYLRGRSSEASSGVLLRAIVQGLPGGQARAKAASRSELQELVATRVRRDFDDELTVNLRGWIVSRTEARLCALVALQRGAGGRSARRLDEL
jgi:hypothetical protein